MLPLLLNWLSLFSSLVTITVALRSLIYGIIAHERQHRWITALVLALGSVICGIVALLRRLK